MRSISLCLLGAVALSCLATSVQADAPVKVYIMAGQSNMIGYGRASGNEPGTLETLVGQGQFTHWGTPGNWNSRDDVWHSAIRSAFDEQWLSIGGGVNDNSFGPELQFGHVMGEHHDEPVLLLKTSIGNRALGWDLLPPGSERYDYNGLTFAGYGDTQETWPVGTEPMDPVPWYAGKEFDDYSDLALSRLANFDSAYPQWEGRGYEIAGFVWFQGHRDGGQEGKAIRYETNMVNFINEWRNVFDAPNAPFVLSTIGFGGQTGMTPNQEIIWQAQLNVDGDTGLHPEFLGNVNTTDARDDWFDTGPSTQGFHYNHRAETYLNVGTELGEAMVDLLTNRAYAEVNRQTGEIKIVVPGTASDIDLSDYTLNSTAGSIDVANYGSIDAGWSASTSTATQVSESGPDLTLIAGTEVSLGVGAWIQSTFEDLEFLYTDTSSDPRALQVRYIGAKAGLGDLDFNGIVDATDFVQFMAGAQVDMSSSSAAQQYAMGDLDGDGDNDIFDFSIFRTAYEADNPPGAFEAMVAAYNSQVPEPSTWLLLATAATVVGLGRYRRVK